MKEHLGLSPLFTPSPRLASSRLSSFCATQAPHSASTSAHLRSLPCQLFAQPAPRLLLPVQQKNQLAAAAAANVPPYPHPPRHSSLNNPWADAPSLSHPLALKEHTAVSLNKKLGSEICVSWAVSLFHCTVLFVLIASFSMCLHCLFLSCLCTRNISLSSGAGHLRPSLRPS